MNGKRSAWVGDMSKTPLCMFNAILVAHVTEECKLEWEEKGYNYHQINGEPVIWEKAKIFWFV